jgi:hypothetical protein
MKTNLFFLLFALGAVSVVDMVDSKKPAENPLFTWDLLWTGSWYKSFKTPEGDLPPSEDFFGGECFTTDLPMSTQVIIRPW